MKSGLEGRNNPRASMQYRACHSVSMKSGLEGRNKSMYFHTNREDM